MPEPIAPKIVNPESSPRVTLDKGTYEILRQRLADHGEVLRERLQKLNAERQDVFGSINTSLLATDRVTTENKCVPRDIVPLNRNRFIFGYNVLIGLKSEVTPADVFSLYEMRQHQFQPLGMELFNDATFLTDFKSLYRFYKNTTFSKFSVIGPHLFMVFQVGKSASDRKTFKWLIKDEGLVYQGNRSDHEFGYPPQVEFTWKRTHRDLHRTGLHPHISIEDRLFVETIQGDLTIKIEDNTETGEGIYSEPVENKDQTLDDAEIHYSIVGNLILLKVRPYQEKNFRHFVFNEKLKQVKRIDAIENSCVLLPDTQGIIFPRGYCLQTGGFKEFEACPVDMIFERRVASPNGEDFLFVFYNEERGEYSLLPYNVIEQKVESPLICDGFSFFENGEVALFKAAGEPQRHHSIQIWQTPFVSASYDPPVKTDSVLYKIGNAEIVRCMAECQDVLVLLGKDDSYGNLYVDLVKTSQVLIDSYFWLANLETGSLQEPLEEIRKAAQNALEEFDKVVRLRRATQEQVKTVSAKTAEIISGIPYTALNEITVFVKGLAALRSIIGEIIELRELRYVDLPAVEALQAEAASHTTKLSNLCIEFLLRADALAPYERRSSDLRDQIGTVKKVTDAAKLEEEINRAGTELEMLIEVVSNLKVEDSTVTSSIVEKISAVYSTLNQCRALLRQKRQELRGGEAVAEFSAQTKLLDQALINYLELCDTPDKCAEFQGRLMVRVEELEGNFADFEAFLVQLSDKRDDITSAFESRKVALLEARHKKANGYFAAAERIFKGVRNRLASCKSVAEINGYFASDLMVEKLRRLIAQLEEMDENAKASDLQSQLKTIREESIRQLKDRQELFVDGENLVQLGKHRFTINTQELALTMVRRDEQMFYHLAGTNFFEKVDNAELGSTVDVWEQEVISENREVYRGEYLAWKFFQELERTCSLSGATEWSAEERLKAVQEFMAPRFEEGYVKGVHDHDAEKIIAALLTAHRASGLLRYAPEARACALTFWIWFRNLEQTPPNGEAPIISRSQLLAAKLRASGMMNELFPKAEVKVDYLREVEKLIHEFTSTTGLFQNGQKWEAAEYLCHELRRGEEFIVSEAAAESVNSFNAFLKNERYGERFASARKTVECDFASTWHLLHDWLAAFGEQVKEASGKEYIDEAACLLMRGSLGSRQVVRASLTAELENLLGNHALIQNGKYAFDLHRFTAKLKRFESSNVPNFQKYQALKHRLLHEKTEQLRLETFKPRVLSSFVRNRLIDSVFLPLIGDNLAKQIGVAGENKRTDLMGMLLLVSPPGYGKTTLMEYVASRLGLVFMKINGPSLGEKVTALDPSVAPNAAAREEILKLNLALEMGDNVMLMIDDIQHCNPEFLQKFISLCDAQRKIEGVSNGRPRNYDLRGRRFVVVMAGNPYTESGEKFKIPDMLANRADTYNLGDIAGRGSEAFKLSYLENALTSNPVLNKIASRSQKDFYSIIQLAESGQRETLHFEANYAVEEIEEMVSVMKKLMRVREIVLKINAEYIRSAAQADLYRTEPPFKLQGSYRNMNRLAERIVPIMNAQELEATVDEHYKNEAQTLATGAESNLLKYKELLGKLTEAEAGRWNEIKRAFAKSAMLRATDERDPVALVVQQLVNFSSGLDSIRDVLSGSLTQLKESLRAAMEREVQLIPAPVQPTANERQLPVEPIAPAVPPGDLREVSISPDTLQKIWDLLEQDGHKIRGDAKEGGKEAIASEVVIRLLGK